MSDSVRPHRWQPTSGVDQDQILTGDRDSFDDLDLFFLQQQGSTGIRYRHSSILKVRGAGPLEFRKDAFHPNWEVCASRGEDRGRLR